MDEADQALLQAELSERQSEPAASEPPPLPQRLGRVVLGYRSGVNLAARWRWLALLVFLASAAAVFAGTGVVLRKRVPLQGPGNIHVLERLDDYTLLVGQEAKNTIPGFLAMPGRVGVFDDTSPPPTVEDIPEAELQRGFCSASLAQLIRQQFPGLYDKWNDADLEKAVVAQRPEYRERLCFLPAPIEATPHDIVKYEVEQSSASTEHPRALLLSTLATAAFALVFSNVFYRLIG